MSHIGDIGTKLRALVAIVAVWALMFGAAVSGSAAASASDIVFKNNGSASIGLFACFKRHMTQRADAASEKAPETKHGQHHCPCCLVAGAVSAVMPERIATVAAPSPAPERPVYFLAAAPALKSNSSRSINGARAPPFPI